MPRYYFHTQTVSRITGAEGMELSDILAARAEAIRTSGELVRDGVATFWGSRPWSVTVTNAVGAILLEIETHGHASTVLPDGSLPDR